MQKNWRAVPGSHYIRRRDKLLVTPTSVTAQGVEYRVLKTGAAFKVTMNGFKLGFRPALPEEIPDEVATAVGTSSSGE